jgi:hypothetical protein
VNRSQVLLFVLDVLDDGLGLYRQHWSRFLLIAACGLLPLAALWIGWWTLIENGSGSFASFSFVVWLALSYSLLLWTFMGLSRATLCALDRQPIALLAALRFHPARGCGALIFNLIFSLTFGICLNIACLPLLCMLLVPLVLFGISPASPALLLLLAGTSVATGAFALQPFVQEPLPWRGAARRTLMVLTTQLEYALFMLISAGALVGGLGIAGITSLLVLLMVFGDGLGVLWLAPTATIIGMLLVIVLLPLLPPLVIWMAVFYRRMARQLDGVEIARRIGAWHGQRVLWGTP